MSLVNCKEEQTIIEEDKEMMMEMMTRMTRMTRMTGKVNLSKLIQTVMKCKLPGPPAEDLFNSTVIDRNRRKST